MDDLRDDIEMPEVYKGLLDKLHSNDSGYGDSESGNSRYPSSKQSEIQSSGTGTLPNDSSGSYTDAYRDSLISHCSTSALFEDGDRWQRDSEMVFGVWWALSCNGTVSGIGVGDKDNTNTKIYTVQINTDAHNIQNISKGYPQQYRHVFLLCIAVASMYGRNPERL